MAHNIWNSVYNQELYNQQPRRNPPRHYGRRMVYNPITDAFRLVPEMYEYEPRNYDYHGYPRPPYGYGDLPPPWAFPPPNFRPWQHQNERNLQYVGRSQGLIQVGTDHVRSPGHIQTPVYDQWTNEVIVDEQSELSDDLVPEPEPLKQAYVPAYMSNNFESVSSDMTAEELRVNMGRTVSAGGRLTTVYNAASNWPQEYCKKPSLRFSMDNLQERRQVEVAQPRKKTVHLSHGRPSDDRQKKIEDTNEKSISKDYKNNDESRYATPTVDRTFGKKLLLSKCTLDEPEVLPMDIFMKIYWILYPYYTPEHALLEGEVPFRDLSNEIWCKYQFSQLSISGYLSKIKTWKQIQIALKKSGLKYKVFIVGSTLSGLSLTNSNLDLCFIKNAFKVPSNQKKTTFHLNRVLPLISQYKDITDIAIESSEATSVLRFRVNGESQCLVDITYNNIIVIANSQLLRSYVRCNWKLQPLYYSVKEWDTYCNSTGIFETSLPSYTIALMVIQFLQCGVNPPILPCLHREIENLREWHDIAKHNQVESLQFWKIDWRSLNNMCLGELFLEFFKFYNELDFKTLAVSVRLGQPRVKYTVEQDLMFVEDPFSKDNTLTSVNEHEFQSIKNAFASASQTAIKKMKFSSFFN